MFFRNLTLFRFSPAVAEDLDRLPTEIQAHRLRAPGPLEVHTSGFVSPHGPAHDELVYSHDQGEHVLIMVGRDERMLPASVVNDELHRKIHRIAEQESRRVGGRERRRLREDLLNELLPRAFVRASRLPLYFDCGEGWLVIDTSSRKSAEAVVTHMREALGSFPVVPPAPEKSPRLLMTDWLANRTLPAGLALGDECELRDAATTTGAIVRARRQEMDSEEMLEHLRNGKQVFQLALVLNDRLSFVLDQNLVIRKLRLLDAAMDALDDSFDSTESELAATFALMTGEVGTLLAGLATWFGISRPADANGDASTLTHRGS
ncbi:MAG: recombination-associated protein RdgC [Dyella sp.]|uniref:recombination-associated protein RdgC n=1 Tax=Dyella sp. TaxID=1869338 RepID=UPI003F7F1734